uniref:Uncharacterized protein n=1 Tax=Anguilla anguilla TaxID=7936 RepID=A0A0E9WPI0_ANGAN
MFSRSVPLRWHLKKVLSLKSAFQSTDLQFCCHFKINCLTHYLDRNDKAMTE